MQGRDVMDILIFIVVGVGLVWAVLRLRQDLRRPLTEDEEQAQKIIKEG
jgi:hypothetical protein